MSIASAALARSITKRSSMQTYLTTCVLVDQELVDDCFRAYAYFRWIDDVVDITCQTTEERVNFIQHQKELIERLYKDEKLENLTPEEVLISDLISHDRSDNSRLQSFIQKFIAVIEFDAHRKGKPISQNELEWYQDCLGRSVTDGIQYFIGNCCPYPESPLHYRGATAAHITHMLRDMVHDIEEGYFNIPSSYLEENDISPGDLYSLPIRAWVQARVDIAREYFIEGKGYLDELDVLRCKIAGYWYCARFEGVLEAIERDGYNLRREYNERRKLTTWIKMALLAASLTIKHFDPRKIAIRRASQNRRSVQF